MLRVRNVTRTLGNVTAVDDVSLDVSRGETFGLLGPNGAGKTTLIHILAGRISPDKGQIRVTNGGEKEEVDADDIPRISGIATQRISLYDALSARDNLVFFGRMYGLSGAYLSRRVTECLDFAGLANRADDPIETFSGGMKRRLNLVVALIHEPDLLFLDEPTVGVDPQSRNHIFENVEQLAARDRTIIYTTHYMEEAQRLCDRVGILDRGKLLKLDDVSTLIEEHGGSTRVEVEFERVPDESLDLPGTLEGRHLFVDTDRPADLFNSINERGLTYIEFRVDPPDLESVFLNLTGRSLRDTGEESERRDRHSNDRTEP